ncbi:MAG: hypothetical protein COU33_04550 [Candidatus Magasanikbacteria bacterium CG10_big_fil_rev_8_21_14_0_10_43_6]|uniref:Glycosyl transferase family 28 C-terminal domain-containing protein n=1 Tax=Candidatus Magasanikbacteria bacterium CG10_big_fil_rev_8_21_14_0_10_43_6 TaxID=1974650 RepID=A0A2M6W0E8_9BACT|nr:MAG: hypothetical protein COU33_04550 [Candidatus Magasanikbacteria bacterium CG10_big_fil_rev_8_21_14_0_10_43_6]
MGYGHQRAAYPLKDIAACPVGCTPNSDNIINANSYAGIPHGDKSTWENSRSAYEFISRLKKLPLVGESIFDAMDYFQRIKPFYPARDLSAPTMQLTSIYRLIKKGWGKHLIDMLNKNPLPMVTSFFVPAFFADEHGYKGEIYAICTDTDISRAWAPLHPKKSRINYLVPNKRVRERLKLYGVAAERIYVTGFPLPKENIGKDLSILKKSLGERIVHLDPDGKYRKKYHKTIEHYLGKKYCKNTKHPLTITFAVGGAGAQREIGVTVMESLADYIKKGNVRMNLVAGSRMEINTFFKAAVKDAKLTKGVDVIFNPHKLDYFGEFNKALLSTDILWTKPSELSFYAALGIPIIMAPTIGSQEEFNRAWLHSVNAGFEQEDPRYTNEWLFDWLSSGWLAEAAMEGFLDAPRNGAYHIEDVVLKGERSEIEDTHLL